MNSLTSYAPPLLSAGPVCPFWENYARFCRLQRYLERFLLACNGSWTNHMTRICPFFSTVWRWRRWTWRRRWLPSRWWAARTAPRWTCSRSGLATRGPSWNWLWVHPPPRPCVQAACAKPLMWAATGFCGISTVSLSLLEFAAFTQPVFSGSCWFQTISRTSSLPLIGGQFIYGASWPAAEGRWTWWVDRA